MSWLLLTCFLLWARHGEGGGPDIPQSLDVECLAGSEWESNCHLCRCSGAGAADCVKLAQCDLPNTVEPIRCKPNTTFERGCNTCVCLDTGLGLCTLKNCQRIPAPAPSKANLPRGTDCAPGTTWKSQCNDCVCSPEGLRFCTEKACPGGDLEPPLRCAPHSLWKRECNTCWCTSDGRAMCTKIGCVGIPSDMHFSDEDQSTESSTDAVEPIIKSAVTQKPTKKVCVENRMFIMNCNTCWCNEDGTSYFCTRRVCVPELPEEPAIADGKSEKLRIIKRECRPDEVFELDCNMCRCNADGKSFSCTRRACVDEDNKNETRSRSVRAAPQEPPKSCLPGQEFRMDCNKCLCDNEGQDFSCTRIDCSAINNNNNGGTRRKRDVSHKVSTDCAPGSVFAQRCNVCRCTEDGGHATCTLKRCARARESRPASADATESSFRCNPGEQFKQSCNDCSCSADGKSVFCTLLVCDEDVKP